MARRGGVSRLENLSKHWWRDLLDLVAKYREVWGRSVVDFDASDPQDQFDSMNYSPAKTARTRIRLQAVSDQEQHLTTLYKSSSSETIHTHKGAGRNPGRSTSSGLYVHFLSSCCESPATYSGGRHGPAEASIFRIEFSQCQKSVPNSWVPLLPNSSTFSRPPQTPFSRPSSSFSCAGRAVLQRQCHASCSRI